MPERASLFVAPLPDADAVDGAGAVAAAADAGAAGCGLTDLRAGTCRISWLERDDDGRSDVPLAGEARIACAGGYCLLLSGR